MKKYTNISKGLQPIEFTDGTGIFLRRGQSIETDQEPVSVPDGIVVVEVKQPKPKRTAIVEVDEDEKSPSSAK